MIRRTRPAALLSAAALLAGAGLSLAFASPAGAVDAPPLGTLSASPSAPVAGDVVSISGDGCLSVPLLPAAGLPTAATPSAGTDAAGAPSAPADATPGSVSITITGPDSFNSSDTATASPDGTWDGDQGITLGGAGTYTVRATCTLVDLGTGTDAAGDVTFDYASLTLDVSAPPQVVDPAVVCNGCDTATPGSQITLVGTQFPASTTATVSLTGYAAVSRPIDDQGGFSGATFTIAANQGTGTIAGTVSAPGITAVPFSVTVTAPTPTTSPTPAPPAVDGTVPTGTPTTDTDDTDTTGSDYTATAPTLPSTGTDSLWPGVIGGLLVLSGGALLWAGRRRDEAATTAV